MSDSARAKPLGTPPPDLADLVRAEDRLSFAYFERCRVSRQDNAITVTDDAGTIHVPAAALGVLMLGPGATVTHRAMEALGENGATVVWVGERGVRMRSGAPSPIHPPCCSARRGWFPTPGNAWRLHARCIRCAFPTRT